MLLWPVDIPRVRSETVRALIEMSAKTPDRVIVPVHGSAGHPPVLPPHVVKALSTLTDDERLDQFIGSIGGAPLALDVDDPGVAHDIDRPEDLW